MKSSFFTKLAVSLFFLSFAVIPFSARAGISENLTGFAWSSNIGWISFNCTNEAGSCTASNYGVNKNADGTLVGHAWSSNIGWIQFGGLSSFPTGPGTYAQNAQVVGSELRGWAKALSADNLGWDGWISLTGTSYGVTSPGSAFLGYAWGGEVVGWVSFDIAGANGVNMTGSASLDVRDAGGVTLQGRNDVLYNTIPTFVWTLSLPVGVTCDVTKTSVGGTVPPVMTGKSTTGSVVGSGLIASTYTYRIACTNGLSQDTTAFTVLAQPANFSISPDGDSNILIMSLPAGTSTSAEKIFRIIPENFTNSVRVTITGISPALPEGTEYCLAASCSSGPYSTLVVGTSPSVDVASGDGATIRVRVPTPLATGSSYTITLRGIEIGGTGMTRFKDLFLTPTKYDPTFLEF